MTTQQAALEDAALTLNDAERIHAGITELTELLTAGRATSIDVTDIARDLYPRLTAIKTWLIEQCIEVTA